MRRCSPGFLGVLAGFAVAIGAAGFGATAAMAADLPVPGAPAAPAYFPPPAMYDWTGIYIGGHLGADLMRDTVTTTTTTVFQTTGTATNVSPFGVVGGAQAGFNIEFAPVVVGFEGTWTATNNSGTQVTGSLQPGNSQQSTDAAPWYATATGRLGFAANDLLIYAKGGAAWMRANYTQSITCSCSAPPNTGGIVSQQTITDTRTGFTVGGGLEYGMTDNWSLKVEYDFLDFGTKTYNFANLSYATEVGGIVTGNVPVGAFPVSIKSMTHMLTAGLNYRFNWAGGGPLVAK